MAKVTKEEIDRLWDAINIIFEALEEINNDASYEISDKLTELSSVLQGA